MIIDFHTHTFPEALAGKALKTLSEGGNINYYTDGTVKGLRRSMALAGIDKSLVLPVATKPEQTEGINEVSAKINETGDESGIIAFGGIHPDNENYADILKGLKDRGIKGIKIHPVFQGVNIDDIRFLRIIEKASELGLIVVTHAGFDAGFPGAEHSSVSHLDNMLKAVRPNKMVLAHMGGWGQWERVPDLISKYWIYVDTSFSLIKPDFKVPGKVWDEEKTLVDRDVAYDIIIAAGYNHILFGSDSPWSSQLDSLNALNDYFDGQDLKMVQGGTAERLLEL